MCVRSTHTEGNRQEVRNVPSVRSTNTEENRQEVRNVPSVRSTHTEGKQTGGEECI